MSDAYDYARERTATILREWNAGIISLKRADQIYSLDARADGAVEGTVEGSMILATDLKVIVSPKALLDGAEVDIVPLVTDYLVIDGEDKVIKRVDAVPASGPAARFHVYVAS